MDSIAIGIAWCVAWGDRRKPQFAIGDRSRYRSPLSSRAIAPDAQLVVFCYLYKFQVF
ncbi:MAG: hypothetical protein JGK10_08870 [Microcoleus sp. PH2017_13_LAR_U_A]|nr:MULTISPECIES: hypothetical protein [unclassified Microcoleus]MCC3471921.1 hypothetical protein [Microcoleus sp. PH2017_13_LAR_U_A]